jgi:hypothetical protein
LNSSSAPAVALPTSSITEIRVMFGFIGEKLFTARSSAMRALRELS